MVLLMIVDVVPVVMDNGEGFCWRAVGVTVRVEDFRQVKGRWPRSRLL